MSLKYLTAVWDGGPNDRTELLVLLALADYADEHGNCFPAMKTIAKKARLTTDRGAQKIIRRLEADGWIKITPNKGQNGTNIYTLTPERLFTPNTVHPEQRAHNPRTAVHPNRKEPPLYTKESAGEISETLEEWASAESVASFLAYRKAHKSKALTLTGAKRLATHLQEIFNAGFDPSDALGMAEERGWASVQPDWYFNAKGQQHVKSSSNQKQAGVAGEDAALKQIARLAGLR